MQHEKLIAWQRADDLFIEIHQLTKTRFPVDERYALSSQARRAAYSVAANIVEGCARRFPRERERFFNIAEASLSELNYCIHVARRLGYVEDELHKTFMTRIRQVGAPLIGLIRSTRQQSDKV
jgi:four helix bundle protein